MFRKVSCLNDFTEYIFLATLHEREIYPSTHIIRIYAHGFFSYSCSLFFSSGITVASTIVAEEAVE